MLLDQKAGTAVTKSADLLLVASRVFRSKMLRQFWNVLSVVPQRRSLDDEDREPVEEIFSESPVRH
jgi:hypothetical protein